MEICHGRMEIIIGSGTTQDDSNLKCYIEDVHGLNSMDKIMEGVKYCYE